jgi:hypothetical protein
VRTTGPKTPQGSLTFHGFVPDTDPRYASGWNYLSGKKIYSEGPQSYSPHWARVSADKIRKALDAAEKGASEKKD